MQYRGLQVACKSSTGGHYNRLAKGIQEDEEDLQIWSSMEPQDFLEKAKEVQHPKNPHNSLPDVLKQPMFQVLSSDPIELAKHRLQVVLAVKRRSGELVNEEKKLKSEMDSTLAEVSAPKSLALWKSLMKETGYHDVSIFDMVCNGIPLYGEHDVPPGAIPDSRPATTSADELLATSVWRRKAIQGASPELDPEHQKDLHEASLAEVAKGHLHGPLSEQQVTEALGDSSWLFSPRFAVYQGDEKKVRPIDDCKRSLIRQTGKKQSVPIFKFCRWCAAWLVYLCNICRTVATFMLSRCCAVEHLTLANLLKLSSRAFRTCGICLPKITW